mgnify:CR=1 FL=1
MLAVKFENRERISGKVEMLPPAVIDLVATNIATLIGLPE